MQISVVYLLFFCAIVLLSCSMFYSTIVVLQRFGAGLSESWNHRLAGLFYFSDTRKLVAAYFLLLVAVPVFVFFFRVPVIMGLVLLVLLCYLPRVIIGKLERARRTEINESLPDALSQMAAAMQSGSTLNLAIESMVAEHPGPVGQEFSLLLREQKLGVKLATALDNLAERVQSEEMDLVVTAAVISQEVGGNLAEIFQRLSDTLRRKLEMEGKIKALTAQGILQGWVVSLLPIGVMFVISVIETDIVKPLFTSLLGWVFLTAIIALQLAGGLVIRKIVTIDI